MNLRRASVRLLRALGPAVLTMVSGPAPAAPPRLDVPIVSTNQVMLRLHGDPGRSYRVEASSNLVTWTMVGEGVALGGSLTVTDSDPGATLPRFYRGVLAPAVGPFPTVRPEANTNLAASCVVWPETGGSLTLGAPDGRVYSFSVPAKAVFEPTLVSLTVVTNIAGIPAAQGFVAAVQLEPAGLVLAAPFFLEIRFPTNLPATRISSYQFDAPARNLHLVPDVVVTNRVRILVPLLDGYGCGAFTTEELASLAATAPPTHATRGQRRLQSSLEDCDPEAESEAKALHGDLRAKFSAVQHRIAAQLGDARQRRLLGVADEDEGLSALGSAMNDGAAFYEEELKPRAADAATPCAESRELLPWLLGWERQRQLLGTVPNDAPGDPMSSELLCHGLRRCEEEARGCCRTKGGDTRLAALLLGIERQRQLLGITNGACGAGADVPGLLDECAPQWFGTLTITRTGSSSTNQSHPGVVSTLDENWDFSMTATVASVTEDISEPILLLPGYTNLTFEMTGSMVGAHRLGEVHEDLRDPCSSGLSATPEPAPAGSRDGEDALVRRILYSSQVREPVRFSVSARILAPGTSGFGITPYLQWAVPQVESPRLGYRTEILKAVDADGCEITDTSGPVSGSDFWGGQTFFRGPGEFSYTGSSIRFLRLTPIRFGTMTAVERVELDLKRVR